LFNRISETLQAYFPPAKLTVDILIQLLYLKSTKIGGTDGSILRKVPGEKTNEEPQNGDHEEQEARYHGNLSNLRHEDVQNRKGLVNFATIFPLYRLGLVPSLFI